ncbi:hypothetical protein GLW08_03110 [Pontibacillus yanchengensis]|uniref:Uncharacterized protein n=2 Tax=Pontibacillus yanchengensis TaxID=462910 RepID=A0ACC7VC26_9BACI|nr:hypothetical protein [Pontibacillus yanchengensis]MYL34693.1 hypothetical protein [Pontibacillus yanchengensis]MYL52322.1 hypothetical protein [Pontibacillus yanchengensis]
MGKKICWVAILCSIFLNVVMLQWTIEAFFGKEFEHVYMYTIIAIASSFIALLFYGKWRKLDKHERA